MNFSEFELFLKRCWVGTCATANGSRRQTSDVATGGTGRFDTSIHWASTAANTHRGDILVGDLTIDSALLAAAPGITKAWVTSCL